MYVKRLLLLVLFCTGSWLTLHAQDEIYNANDVRDNRLEIYFFTNATIQVDYQTKLENASMIVRGSTIEAVGTNLTAPEGARKIDLKGKYIYPSMIDLYSDYGLPEVKRDGGNRWSRREQITPKTEGPYAQNDANKAHYDAVEEFSKNEKTAKGYREAGFGAVMTARRDGIARGTGALVTLSDKPENEVVLKMKAAAHYSFDKGTSQQDYPWSSMGYIALLRQAYLDADWYARNPNNEYRDLTLEAWNANRSLPQVFDAPGWIQILRADKVGDEFGVQYIIRGNGDEYQRLEAIKATNAPLIVPVNFPDAFDVTDPYDANNIALEDMMHWELAPSNLARLANAGISFAITSEGLKKQSELWKNLRQAMQYGLSEQDAMKALTYTPAQLLGVENQLGSIKAGAVANFLITSDNLFTTNDAVIYENWVQGSPFVMADKDAPDLSGEYSIEVDGQQNTLEISGAPGKHKFKLVVNDSTKLDVKAEISGSLLTLSYQPDKKKDEKVRLSGWLEGKGMKGRGQRPDGTWFDWQASFTKALESNEKENEDMEMVDLDELAEIVYPFLPFGNAQLPTQGTYLFKNATVWTNEEEGILEETDVLVKDGKISKVGKNLSDANATVIDATGKHLTSGIIDEHSHIALSSVNDVATFSSMVRMNDVVNSEDINIYRQMAGGVTASQLLHGSANPVGGQSALVKLRWGATPEEMIIQGADGFIKFALGENVKRSRSSQSIRYPQTRMGVEQVFMDGFTRAKEYDEAWKKYNGLSSRDKTTVTPPRRDLMLEAMAEIINKKRFISCHSYVQSEINMLMHVAEKFDFNVNTFTHILEGYKVADKMAAHGAAGSTFADWWAYKFEVRYAIPYNPMLMTMAGVTTAINSDDAEMARRLNQEAAKSVKYGGMSQEEAWKMVTLNPAKMLHLDDRMGSVKVGKDADLVLWTDNPLSIYAKVEKTLIDGRIYFDKEEDMQKREMIAKERARLIQKMETAGKNGARTRPASRRMQQMFHCDDLEFGSVLGEE